MPAITPDEVGGTALTRFLDLIAHSEGTANLLDRGYGAIVSGVDGHHSFTDYSQHPFQGAGAHPILVKPAHGDVGAIYSTASGRYQLLLRYWPVYKSQLHLPDFGPRSQDMVALQQMRERKAVAMVQAGAIEQAIEACSNVWASFPGNSYGQGGKSMPDLLAYYNLLS